MIVSNWISMVAQLLMAWILYPLTKPPTTQEEENLSSFASIKSIKRSEKQETQMLQLEDIKESLVIEDLQDTNERLGTIAELEEEYMDSEDEVD